MSHYKRYNLKWIYFLHVYTQWNKMWYYPEGQMCSLVNVHSTPWWWSNYWAKYSLNWHLAKYTNYLNHFSPLISFGALLIFFRHLSSFLFNIPESEKQLIIQFLHYGFPINKMQSTWIDLSYQKVRGVQLLFKE